MTYCRKCLTMISSEKADNFNGYCEKCYHNVESNPNSTTISDNIISENEDKKQNIKKNLLIFGSIIGLFLLMFLPFLFKSIYISVIESEYIKSVENILNEQYQQCEDIIFNGDYNENVSIYMHSDFNNLNYQEKEKIILDITISIRNEFLGYYNKISRIEKNLKINSSHNKIVLYCEDDYYESDYDNQTIKRNNKIYDLKIGLKEQIYSKIQDENYQQYIDNIDNTEMLQNIVLIENIDECKNEIIYLSAIKSYNNDDFEKAIEQFNLIEEDYKDKRIYIEQAKTYINLQGTWYGTTKVTSKLIDNWKRDLSHKWIIKGKKCYSVYSSITVTNGYDEYYLILQENNAYISKKETLAEKNILYEIEYINNSINYTINDISSFGKMKLTKQSNSTVLPKTVYIKEPAIGMTKSEVENSTWGKPTKINKTTTAYGVSEQWVYSNYRYIYFDDGIVTAIQD